MILIGGACIYFTESALIWLGLTSSSLTLLAIAQLIAVIIVMYSYIVHNKRATPSISESINLKSMPSVSVCIPARNESKDLEECLNLLIASKYPKLEILVYDDSSQPKATPQIKKMYANSGIKFVNGVLPSDKWLAKNYGYQRLLDESNGEILIFCGVDTKFEPDTVDGIVKKLSNGTAMLSVLPQNELPKDSGWLKYLIQPTRYAWEIGLPRWLVNRPPVLSTCWAIQRKAIDSFGGFEAVSHKVVPESYFARQCIAHNQKYEFLFAGTDLLLKNMKSVSEQKSTAIRTRYPQLHRRIENTMLASLIVFFVYIGPFPVFVLSVVGGLYIASIISAISICLGFLIYGKMVNLTYRSAFIKAYFMAPVAAIYDIWILNYSMWQYEFGSVMWKGRDIAIPVINRSNQRNHLL